MAIFRAKINNAGNGFEFPDKGREKFLEYASKNKGRGVLIDTDLTESRKQRGFYHGAVLTLWAYLDGKDYRDNEVVDKYHEVAKLEFNAEPFVSNGKTYKIGGSTKGKLNKQQYIDRIIDYLEGEYAIDRTLCLDTKHYRYFKDKIFMNGEFDTYIDYLKFLNRLPIIHN